MNLTQAYRAERASLFVRASDTGRMIECRERASTALHAAKIKLTWKAADGYEFWGDLPPDEGEPGLVRLVLRHDNDSPADDFDGSERDLKAARERANRDGMWGIESQFWDGAEWQYADSCWGFIGDDWKGSGYDVDLMASALDALRVHNLAQTICDSPFAYDPESLPN